MMINAGKGKYSMEENSYEAYKRDFAHARDKRDNLRRGKCLLATGICLLLFFLYIFPFRAGRADEICGDEIKAGNAYDPIQIYYIENLQLLCANADIDDDKIYCVAKFADCNENDWLISFTSCSDEGVAGKIRDSIQYSSLLESKMNLTISGYFQIRYLDAFPFAVNSFYSANGSKYANAGSSNILNLNADYLCKRTDNFMLALLSRPGTALGFLAASLTGIICGGILLVQNRSHKTE